MSEKSERFIENLALALFHAKEAAAEAYALDPEDGGSCNFDSPYIQFPQRTRKALIEAAATKAGIRMYPHWQIKSRWLIGGLAGGQGNSRTRAAEAARTELRKHDYDAGMHYQID